MNQKLIEKCELLVKNRELIDGAFKLDRGSMSIAGGAFYVGLGIEADVNKMKECEAILKSKAGVFSEFRGYIKMPLLCKMAIADDPENYFDSIQNIVNQMKHLKWSSSEYKVLAAIIIYDNKKTVEVSETIEKLTELYKGMKKDHPWLTGGEDIPFAAMLAVSEGDVKALLVEMENCYKELKGVGDMDAIQSLSHVLALNPASTSEKCNRVIKLFNTLKERKHKYGKGFELAVLGTVISQDDSIEAIADKIIEADDFLKPIKGFGSLAMGDIERRMYAALMVIDEDNIQAANGIETTLNATLSTVIQIFMMVIMVSSITTSVVLMD